MYDKVIESLSHNNVQLVAVSKTKPIEAIQTIYNKGQRHFGENKVQELVDKQSVLPSNIKWHFIGHLQRNKVKYIVPFVHLIHSVDSLRLAQKINEEAVKIDKVIDILIQISISKELTKFGWNYEDVLIHQKALDELSNIRIVGFMGMATNTKDKLEIKKEFSQIRTHFQNYKTIINKDYFKELSIGMSSDYIIALEESATLVRIGSLIFGARNN